MKSTLSLIILCTFVLGTNAQFEKNYASIFQDPVQDNESSMVIKTNLLGLALYVGNLGIEYKTGEKTSIGILSGYKIKKTYTLKGVATGTEAGTLSYTGEITPQGFYINPYFRYYTEKALEGFYVEAFLRYYSYEYQVPYQYTKDEKVINANGDGTADGMGGGLALGTQMRLGPQSNVIIDLYAGGGIVIGNAHAETNDPNLDAEDFADIKAKIEENQNADVDIFLLGNILQSFEADANASSAWVDLSGEIIPILRAGICIGFIF